MPDENQPVSGTLYDQEQLQQQQPKPEVHPEEQQGFVRQGSVSVKEATLVAWTSPARPFKPRSKDFYVKLFAMATLFAVVIFVIEGIMPVFLIIALLFLFYVLSTVQPENVDYKITNRGIRIGEKLTDWDGLGRFWFEPKVGVEMLNIEAANITGRLEIMVPNESREKVESALEKYLLHESVPPTFLDKAARWAGSRLPLE